MVNKKINAFLEPSVDTSYGLVYRLNYLWSNVDMAALRGDYQKWNILLDRLFCNLTYKEDMVIDKDEMTGIIKSIKLSDEDYLEYKKLNDMVRNAISKIRTAKTRILLEQAKEDRYQAMMLKDIWTRKLMQRQGLYLKITERNPARALFGGG